MSPPRSTFDPAPREQLEVAESLASVDPADWDALAGDGPFMRHGYLSALLESGCASAATGWRPRFLLLRRGERLAGAVPMFAKTHSRGEYVFDWSWADAYTRHGLGYYPKLVCAVPFTPVTGPRILARDSEARTALLAAVLDQARGYSSVHVLFPGAEEAEALRAAGFRLRHNLQFHWRNEKYKDFEDFLGRLSHRRRKNIRQERRHVCEAGVTFRRVSGAESSRQDWEHFYRCYRHTYAAHGSSPYLNLDFFLRLAAAMPESLRLFIAERAGRPVAASLCLERAGRLYGRYWGALEPIPLLHFEACYYQPIDYAIEAGLEVFEGGAQGEHKIFRGLMPVETFSAHWIADRDFARAVETFLAKEEQAVHRYIDELAEHSPFRNEHPRGVQG